MARIAHPQTNGKIERVHKEIERHLASFEAESAMTATRCDRPGGHFTVGGPFHAEGPNDPIDRLVAWYNYERDHMSLDEGETPAMAYARRMPPGGSRSRTSSRAYPTGADRRKHRANNNLLQARGGCTLFGSYTRDQLPPFLLCTGTARRPCR